MFLVCKSDFENDLPPDLFEAGLEEGTAGHFNTFFFTTQLPCGKRCSPFNAARKWRCKVLSHRTWSKICSGLKLGMCKYAVHAHSYTLISQHPLHLIFFRTMFACVVITRAGRGLPRSRIMLNQNPRDRGCLLLLFAINLKLASRHFWGVFGVETLSSRIIMYSE